MTPAHRSGLRLIKTLHTIIWAILASTVVFVAWSGLTASVSGWSWMAVAAVTIEGIVLLIFGGSCPLTKVARKYTSSTRDNFDIYLPTWLAKYNKIIFGTIFIFGLVLMLINQFSPEFWF
jgi:hypothetical protein